MKPTPAHPAWQRVASGPPGPSERPPGRLPGAGQRGPQACAGVRMAGSPRGRLPGRVASLLLVLGLGGCQTPSGGSSGWGLFDRAAPDEDTWSIRCISIAGPQRFPIAAGYEQALRKVPGLDPRLVQVHHEDNESRVYYGQYRKLADPRQHGERYAPDPLPALNLIRSLSMEVDDPATGKRVVWPFSLATIEPLPSAQGGNPEWDLARVRDGYWSLQVAVFYNTEHLRRRKQAAMEYCKLLREQGHEAYYHHGPANSSVCVGVFPKAAIANLPEEDPLTGAVRFVDRIVDPRMLELQKKFPYNLENGHITRQIIRDPRTGEIKERVPTPSFPVRIPAVEDFPS